MSNAPLDYIDTGDSYNYPNIDTYRAMRGNGASLSHGFIYSLSTDGTSNYKYVKKFQFNPPAVSMSIGMVATDAAAAVATGGNVAASSSGVGIMQTAFELMFNRESEVFLATRRFDGSHPNLAVGRFNDQSAEIFRRIGVMKDVYDLFRVVLATQDDVAGVNSIPTEMTMSALTKRAYDLSASGALLAGTPVGIVFGNDTAQASANLAWYGFINSFQLTFNKFNKYLVPTQCQVNLGLDVLQARSAAQIDINSAGAQPSLATTPVPTYGPGDTIVTTPASAGSTASGGKGLPRSTTNPDVVYAPGTVSP